MTKSRPDIACKGLLLVAALALLIPGGASAQNAPAAGPPRIDWQVADRFRLFSQADALARDRVDGLMTRIANAPPNTPLSNFHDDFRDTLALASGASLRTSNYSPPGATGGSGRYRADYLYPSSYRIILHSDEPRLQNATCRWTSPAGSVSGACAEPLALPLGPAHASGGHWQVRVEVSLHVDGEPDYLYPIAFDDRLIVALGDSYVSGEGNPDVPSIVTDAPLPVFETARWGAKIHAPAEVSRATWWDEPCHRSLLSWPVLATIAYAAHHPQQAVTLVHLGCSGAGISDLLDRGEADMPGGGTDSESQLAQLRHLLTAGPPGQVRRPDTILLSIGGNDAGFAGVIKTLVLPPDGYLVPGGAAVIGTFGGAICPYRNTAPPLRDLCFARPSAETRMGSLPASYRRLGTALAALGGSVHQFNYPNPILGAQGRPCSIAAQRDPAGPTQMTGFEALMGYLPSYVQISKHYSWDFALDYAPESIVTGELFPGAGCDWSAEPQDSEVCQGLWVHASLNHLIEGNAGAPNGWHVVRSHSDAIAGHGLCRRDAAFEVALPRVRNGQWDGGWTPHSLHAYDAANERWFRTPNDSLLTQYGDAKHFHQGSFHPTLRAHLAYAQAALDEALGP